MDIVRDDAQLDPKEELLQIISERLSTIKRKRGEIKSQIDQTELMVNREQQRNSDLAADLQTIQANLDSLPREDIRDRYNEALDARFRLATMRGQLEKFQSHYDYLEQEAVLLNQILSKFKGVEMVMDEEDVIQSDNRAAVNIVRVVQAQEEERQRLARQMHDGPAQSLTNFILQAEICYRLFDRDPKRAAEELDNLKTSASSTFQKVRDFIFDLRPMMLDDLGLVPTVRRYADSYREKTDIIVKLDINGEERRLETHREVMIFRCVQELMGHARDYASASEVQVHLDMNGERIKIGVRDNGRGFDAEAVFGDEGHRDARAQGLVTLREKFELVGGTLSINSNENEGTQVRVEIPSH